VEECIPKRSQGWADRDFPGLVTGLLRMVNSDIATTKDVVANDTAIDWAIPIVKKNCFRGGNPE
jgi:hypothetical protein